MKEIIGMRVWANTNTPATVSTSSTPIGKTLLRAYLPTLNTAYLTLTIKRYS